MSQEGIWAWDDTNKVWVKVKTDDQGRLYTVAVIDNLSDIGDVDLTGIADDDVIYWDDAAGKWKPIAHLGVADAHHAAFTPADHTGIGDGAPHHAEAHDLASHTTKAHAELTGVGAADHHAAFTPADHTGIGDGAPHHAEAHDLASHTTKAHAELTGVGADDHHAQAHDLASHSTKAHAELTNVTAAQHHAKYTNGEAVSAVEAAGLALASGKNIKVISALTANHTWSGLSAVMTAGIQVLVGQACFVSGASKMLKALATDTSTMPAIALATTTIASDAEGEFLMQGFFRNDTWDWTPGGILYVSRDTAGALTQTAPSTAGDQVQVVGVAITADIIYFNPSLELVEIS